MQPRGFLKGPARGSHMLPGFRAGWRGLEGATEREQEGLGRSASRYQRRSRSCAWRARGCSAGSTPAETARCSTEHDVRTGAHWQVLSRGRSEDLTDMSCHSLLLVVCPPPAALILTASLASRSSADDGRGRGRETKRSAMMGSSCSA
eukprot:2452936-Rhodomonas_salina.4